jgi:ABC-2 type transport system ATP-binding protein
MTNSAVSIDGVSKYFRLYHEKNQYLKSTLLKGRRSRYDEFWALQDVSFEIPRGSTFGIIGSNGSGKSTLLKCLAGILTPDRGALEVNGRISALLELGAGFHPDLTGRENIYLNGAILGMTNKDIDNSFDEIVDFASLGQFIETPVKNYSSGMVVRLGFAIATNVNPEILIIDEVLAVGDASFQQRCYEKIESFRSEGRTIILVSHGLSQITQLCDEAAWIQKGTLKMLGNAFDVVSSYSGESHAARPKVDASEIGERWGSGEAEILSATFLDLHAQEVTRLQTSASYILRITFEASQTLSELVAGVRFSTLHGITIWGTNTKRCAVKVSSAIGLNHIDLHIDDFPLLEGSYNLTVALSDMSEVHQYDHWENRIRFDVVQHGTFDEGISQFKANWEQNF